MATGHGINQACCLCCDHDRDGDMGVTLPASKDVMVFIEQSLAGTTDIDKGLLGAIRENCNGAGELWLCMNHLQMAKRGVEMQELVAELQLKTKGVQCLIKEAVLREVQTSASEGLSKNVEVVGKLKLEDMVNKGEHSLCIVEVYCPIDSWYLLMIFSERGWCSSR